MKQDTYSPSIRAERPTRRVVIVTGDNCHDLEFFYPYYRFAESNIAVDVATPAGGVLKGKFGMEIPNTRKVEDLNPEQYDLLYLPGGKAPETLKQDQKVLGFVKRFVESGKPVAAICHGAQILASAEVIKGKRIAAWPEVQEEIETAGGSFVNEACVTDGPFITARWPGDLPGHLKEVMETLGVTAAARKAA